MSGRRGAIVLLNAQTGEILVMASHPTFNANHLSETAAGLIDDPQKPLINRAALGVYPTDSALEPFAFALFENANPNQAQWQIVYETFGFLRTPELLMDVAASTSINDNFYVSPLQMALASAALSNGGVVPAPRIAVAVNTPNDGWVVLPAAGTSIEAGIGPSAGGSRQDNTYLMDGGTSRTPALATSKPRSTSSTSPSST